MSSFWSAFRSWRIVFMIPLGFASGLPNPLVGSTLTAWMRAEHVDLTTIGFFALVSLPYNLKFLWAPVIDRYRLPWLSRRRDWMILSQLALLLLVGIMGGIDPVSAPAMMAMLAIVVAFTSATQDIAADAYRTDLLPSHERASGTAVWVAAYRVAMIAAGAFALYLADRVPWQTVYWIMAALMTAGAVATAFAPVPEAEPPPPRTFLKAVVEPLKEFFTRKGIATTLVIVMTYKVGDAFAGHMLPAFLQDAGFTLTEMGAVNKGLGLLASIGGALVGGGFVAKLGLRRSLLIFGVLQAVANVLYAVLAVAGRSFPLFVTAIGVDQLCGGLGTAAFIAFLMSLCDRRYTAFQFALLTSAGHIVGRLLAAGAGAFAEVHGWPTFFVGTIVVAAPALVLLLRKKDLDE